MTIQSVDPGVDVVATARAAETEVLLAAANFGTVLRESPEFVRLRDAGAALGTDDEAQEAIGAFNRWRSDLQLEIRLGTLDGPQQAELERLQAVMLALPTVEEYIAAQSAFEEICRETATLVSSEIGIDFAANCRAGGCCG